MHVLHEALVVPAHKEITKQLIDKNNQDGAKLSNKKSFGVPCIEVP